MNKLQPDQDQNLDPVSLAHDLEINEMRQVGAVGAGNIPETFRLQRQLSETRQKLDLAVDQRNRREADQEKAKASRFLALADLSTYPDSEILALIKLAQSDLANPAAAAQEGYQFTPENLAEYQAEARRRKLIK